MIRIEITRRIDAKQGRGRNRISPVIVSHEPTADEALARIAAIRDAGEALAPGYMPILGASLYDGDAFLAWVKAGGDLRRAGAGGCATQRIARRAGDRRRRSGQGSPG